MNCKDSNSGNIYKEIYKRFVIPFYIPLLVLVSLLLTLSSKESLKYRRLKFMSQKELLKDIKNSYIKNEEPLTADNNYLILTQN